MTTTNDDRWAELVQAELATADAPASAEGFRRVADAYEAAGFANVSLSVLRKTASFGIESHAVLPALLKGFRAQRQFAELNTAVQSALSIQDPEGDLRRELAKALACLNQVPAADREWASLIRAGSMNEADWESCACFVMNCPDAPSLAQMITAIQERKELRSHPLAAYCVARHLIDPNTAAALEALREIDLSLVAEGNTDILLDLAILAWRLHDYARAEQVATLALKSASDPTLHRNVLASVRSFAGDFSHLRKVSMPRAREAGKRVARLALERNREETAWGLLYRQGPDRIEAKIIDLAAEPDMGMPDGLDLVASFSLLPQSPRTDPFPILCGVDWSWPHILLQRKPDGDALHVFVEARGHKDWAWEEVIAEAAAAGSAISTTWAQAMQELRAEDDEPGEIQ